MNRSDVIRNLNSRCQDLPKHDVTQAVNLLLEIMADNLTRGGRCEIRGFGVFSIHTRKARMARNPKTGEPVSVPEVRIPHFKPGKLLKERVNLGRPKHLIQG